MWREIVLAPQAVQDLRRLRVGEIRVFYDVTDGRVEILAVVPKSKAKEWLRSLEE